MPVSEHLTTDLPPRSPLAFEGFVFDPARGALLGTDGAELPLRPKSFTLLAHMLGHAGRLVTREELLDAVWPGVYVSDDSITQCVGDIRRALGDGGSRILRTVPKRGYLLDVPVVAVGGDSVLAGVSAVPGEPADVTLRRPGWPRSRLVVLGGLLAALAVVVVMATGRVTSPPPANHPSTVAELTPQQQEARRLYQEGQLAFRGRLQPDGWLAAQALQERAIAADPSFAPAYAEAAFSHANMVSAGKSIDPAKDLATAETLARRAVALGPDLGVTYSALGAVLRNQRRPAEALENYRMAFALDPTQIWALSNVSLMLTLTGQPAAAIAPIEQALKARPDNPDVMQWSFYLGMAELLQGTGDYGAAAFRRSLEPPVHALLPVDARRLYLAAALALQGQSDSARAMADAARSTSAFMTIGWFRAHPLSDTPAYLDAVAILYRGLAAAGVPD